VLLLVLTLNFIVTSYSILQYCFDLTERKNMRRTRKQLLERHGSFLDVATKTKTLFSGECIHKFLNLLSVLFSRINFKTALKGQFIQK